MIIPLTELQDRRAVRLSDCWNERRGTAEFPSRDSFDPLDLVFALGNIVLVEVAYDPLRFRLKLVGSNIARYLGHDATGQYVDEYRVPEYRDILQASYTEALEQRAPIAVRRNQVVGQLSLRYESVLLPLSEGNGVINMFITGVFFPDCRAIANAGGMSAFAPMPERLPAFC